MANSSTPTGLQDLPGEILTEVAGYLSKRSLAALRLTSKSMEANTFHSFIDKNFKHLGLDLTLPNIQYVLGQLRYYNVAYQVKHITFTDRQPTGTTKSTDEIYSLLKDISGLLPSLTSVSIIGHSTAICQVFRVLGEQSPYQLTSFSLRNSQASTESLHSILKRHRGSLRTMSLDYVRCPLPSWRSTFELMRDELNLETLTMGELLSNDNYEDKIAFLWDWGPMPMRKFNRAIREPVTRKIQTCVVAFSFARMTGPLAIKDGLAFIVPGLRQYNHQQLSR